MRSYTSVSNQESLFPSLESVHDQEWQKCRDVSQVSTVAPIQKGSVCPKKSLSLGNLTSEKTKKFETGYKYDTTKAFKTTSCKVSPTNTNKLRRPASELGGTSPRGPKRPVMLKKAVSLRDVRARDIPCTAGFEVATEKAASETSGPKARDNPPGPKERQCSPGPTS